MSTRITGQPPPPRDVRESGQAEKPKKADDAQVRGAQTSASVKMEELAARVKKGQAVGAANLLTSHVDDPDPLAAQVQQGLVTSRWAIKGLLEDDGEGRRHGGQDGQPEDENVPEIPLEDVPYDVVTSPLGRAYRAVRWLKAVHLAEAAKTLWESEAAAKAALEQPVLSVLGHQAMRAAVARIQAFLTAEKQRVEREIGKECVALIQSGKTVNPNEHLAARRFTLPRVQFVNVLEPPLVEPADLGPSDQAAMPLTREQSALQAGGGTGSLTDLTIMVGECETLKGTLIDETADLETALQAACAPWRDRLP